MQFKVPQNVEREDTIIGSITFKQLIIMVVGGGITFAFHTILSASYSWVVWGPVVLVCAGLTIAFAFVKPYTLDFHVYLLNLLEYMILGKKRIWKQGEGDIFISPFIKKDIEKKEESPEIKNPNRKDLKELSKILDSQGKSNINTKDV